MKLSSLCAAALLLSGCGLTYKPYVDFAASGVSPARYDADVEQCRSEGFAAARRYHEEHPMLALGFVGVLADRMAVADGPTDPGANLTSRPGGIFRYIDACMREKGYKVS